MALTAIRENTTMALPANTAMVPTELFLNTAVLSIIAIRAIKAVAEHRTSTVDAAAEFANRAVAVFSLVAARAIQRTLNGQFRHTSNMAEVWWNWL